GAPCSPFRREVGSPVEIVKGSEPAQILASERWRMKESPTTRLSLLARLRNADDVQAWEDFVNLYAPLVYGLARRHGLQDADAADLSQDVLRAVVQAVPRFAYDPARGSFRGWLFTVARNRIRRRALEDKRELPSEDSLELIE